VSASKALAVDTLAYHLSCVHLTPVRELVFAKAIKRRWRFDFAFPEQFIAAEVEGGTWKAKSRHTSGAGYEGDCFKYNAAVLLGWRVLRFTSGQVTSGYALTTILAALQIEASA
jgi:hypothetical protein